MKHFIFVNPIMSPWKLTPNLTENYSELSCLNRIETAVSFPILVALKNTVTQNERIQFTIIKMVGHDCTEKNYKTFLAELDAIQYGYDLYGLYQAYYGALTPKQLQTKLSNERKDGKIDPDFAAWLQVEIDRFHKEHTPLFSYEIQIIETPYDEKPDTQVHLLFDLIAALQDAEEEDLYVDLSFGSKPIPIVMNMVLTYLYQHRNGIIPKTMSYAQFAYDGKSPSKLYDVSCLIYIQSALIHLEKTDMENPIEAIQTMLNLEDTEEV